MNRRSFMGATSAALAALVPSWWLPKLAAAQRLDLSIFCEDDDWSTRRYRMDRPFEQGAYVYATDARVAVRALPSLCSPKTDETERLPPADRLWWPDESTGGWRPIAAMVREDDESKYGNNCPTCSGKGRIGEGVVECPGCYSGDWPMACKTECPGYVGGMACPECEGCGSIDYLYRLDGSSFAAEYVGKLSTLPDAEVRLGDLRGVNSKGYEGDVATALQVRFAGGQGLLMPLNR